MQALLLVFLILLIVGAARAGGPLFGGLKGSLPSARRSKCSDCVHARKVFDDGTLCGFGKSETFKNSVHVQNCVDHRRK